jgi:nucleoside-diphosphate-sugar epimerase
MDSGNGGVVARFVDQALLDAPLTVVKGQARDFTYVDDACRATLAAAYFGGPGAVYNVGTGAATAISELADAVSCAVRGSAFAACREYVEPRWCDDVVGRCVDINRARTDLDYIPAWSLRAGLAETVRWQRERLR